MKKRKVSGSKIRLWVFLTFILFSILFSLSLGVFDINQVAIQNFLANSQNYPRTMFFIIIMTLAVATTLPVNMIALAGLFVFDFAVLFWLTLFSIILGVLIMYFLAKKLGADGFEEYAGIKGAKAHKLNKLVRQHKDPLMVLLSFVYFFPSNMAGITAAFTGTHFSKFFWIGFLGNAINILFFITLAKALLINNFPLAVVSGLILVLNSLVPIVYYRKNVKEVAKLVLSK